jgi:hypothetical protein
MAKDLDNTIRKNAPGPKRGPSPGATDAEAAFFPSFPHGRFTIKSLQQAGKLGFFRSITPFLRLLLMKARLAGSSHWSATSGSVAV